MRLDYSERELLKMSTARLMVLRSHTKTVPELCLSHRCNRIMRMRGRKKKGLCTSFICHGPGHQTNTFCDLKGSHRLHHARYGRHDQEAYWSGKLVYSGFFDEPPDN